MDLSIYLSLSLYIYIYIYIYCTRLLSASAVTERTRHPTLVQLAARNNVSALSVREPSRTRVTEGYHYYFYYYYRYYH